MTVTATRPINTAALNNAANNIVAFGSSNNAALNAYLQTANGVNNGLSYVGDQINNIYNPNEKEAKLVKFVKKSAQTIARKIVPSQSAEDDFVNTHFGSEGAMETTLFYELFSYLSDASTTPGLFFREDKLVKIWEKLKACKTDKEIKEVLRIGIGNKKEERPIDDVKYVINYFKDFEERHQAELKNKGSSFNEVLKAMGHRSSGFRQIRDFAILPFFGSLLFNAGQGLMGMGIGPGAQAAFLSGTALTSASSFLIAESVANHLDFKNINNQYIRALVPFIKVGTILSHTVAPILNMFGIAFDFKGLTTGESNAFGKVNDFVSTAFSLLSPLSMLGFALNHLSSLNKVKESYGTPTKGTGFLGEKIFTPKKGHEHLFKFSSGADKFGIWVNMIGFAFWGISQVASLIIENHEKSVNKKFEPIIDELHRRLEMEQEQLIKAVKSGQITQEEAIAYYEQTEKEAQQFIQQQLLPAYDAQMKGWKTASWATKVVSWLSFLGVSIQMYTGSLRNIGNLTAQYRDSGMTLGKAFKQSIQRLTQDDMLKKIRVYGGMAVGPIALVFGSLIEGISTIFSEDSPFTQSGKNGVAQFAENIRKNPMYELFQSMAMFG
ncbi:MAG: hypothetical protein QNJ31_08010 [Candidatus Caenarcaniphilales bacterium]|nr:hypothetical protein [Candidatus Caenarcaniphilales bacterium]